MRWIGYVGLTALTLCWIPQSIDTIKQGRCPINLTFLILSSLGSFTLVVYARSLGDPVFTILNTLTTLGAALNVFYKIFPREPQEEAT
jgi:MtN3 and saliva related transmembrane protein